MQELHNKLLKRGGWYAFWHSQEGHQYAHWLLFILVAIFLTSLVALRVKQNYPTYGLASLAARPGAGIPAPPLPLTFVFTHPEAAADAAAAAVGTVECPGPYPTFVGVILTINDYNGKLYFGYGDYGNSCFVGTSVGGNGLEIRSYDPVTATSTGEFKVTNVSEISRFVTIGNRLYVGSIEDQGGGSDISPEFTYRTADSGWVGGNSPALFIHMYDMASLNGTDLWLFGGTYPYDGLTAYAGGSAMRSPDGGTTWDSRDSATYLNTTDGTDLLYPRLYFGAAYQGKLFTQNPASTVSKIFDPAVGSWTNGPDLLPDTGGGKYPRYAIGSIPLEFAGKLLYSARQAGYPGYDRMLAFDGSRVTDGLKAISRQYGKIADMQVYNGNLYVLAVGSNGFAILRTADLAKWEAVGTLPIPSNWQDWPYSFCILNDVIYIGFGNSKIYSTPLPASLVPLN